MGYSRRAKVSYTTTKSRGYVDNEVNSKNKNVYEKSARTKMARKTYQSVEGTRVSAPTEAYN